MKSSATDGICTEYKRQLESEYIAGRIDYHVNMIRRRFSLSDHDADDVRQGLYLKLVIVEPQYDSARASPATFMSSVLEFESKALIRKYGTSQRLPERSPLSLEAMAESAPGAYDAAIAYDADGFEAIIRTEEVSAAVGQLKPDQAATANELKAADSKVEAAANLGVSRSTVHRHVKEMRESPDFQTIISEYSCDTPDGRRR